MTVSRQYKYKGETRIKTVLSSDEKAPISVKEIARNINNYFWYRRTVSEGTKGPITYEFTKRRVILSSNGLPQKTVWLIIRRSLSSNTEYDYFISTECVNENETHQSFN